MFHRLPPITPPQPPSPPSTNSGLDSAIVSAKSTLKEHQRALAAAKGAVREAATSVAQLDFMIHCLQASLGKKRNLTDGEYLALKLANEARLQVADLGTLQYEYVRSATGDNQFDMEKFKQELDKAKQELKDAKQEVEKAKQEVKDAEARVEKAEARVEKAELKVMEEAKRVAKLPEHVRAEFISMAKALQPQPDSSPRVALKGGRKLTLLVSGKNYETALSANGVGVPIRGVPLNRREGAEDVLYNYINLPLGKESRVNALLCNCGARGSGKTVLLGLNMYWFCKHFKNGCAIEVTFNDDIDQLEIRCLPSEPARPFETRVACLILCRLVSFQSGLFPGSFTETEETLRTFIYENSSMLFPNRTYAISDAISMVREVLGLVDAPVLLCVDEVKAASTTRLTAREVLEKLEVLLDDAHVKSLAAYAPLLLCLHEAKAASRNARKVLERISVLLDDAYVKSLAADMPLLLCLHEVESSPLLVLGGDGGWGGVMGGKRWNMSVGDAANSP
jgi:uncharacterized protein YukE